MFDQVVGLLKASPTFGQEDEQHSTKQEEPSIKSVEPLHQQNRAVNGRDTYVASRGGGQPSICEGQQIGVIGHLSYLQSPVEVVDAQPDNPGCEIDRSNDAYNAVATIPHIAETRDTVDMTPKRIQDFVNRLIRHAKKCWIGQEALFEAKPTH